MDKLRELKLEHLDLKRIWSNYVEISKSRWAEGGDARASVIGPYIIALAVLIPLLFMIFD